MNRCYFLQIKYGKQIKLDIAKVYKYILNVDNLNDGKNGFAFEKSAISNKIFIENKRKL